MTPPLVSICSITFNHAPYVRASLDSLLGQNTHIPYEIVIHDDASSDGTADIIREYIRQYPNLFVPILQTENQYSKGRGILCSFSVPNSHGKYIAFCEGDDYWCDPDKLQRQVDFLESHPEVGMVYGRVRNYENDKGQFTGEFGGPYTEFEDLFFNSTIPTATVMARTDLVRQYYADVKPQGRGWAMGDYPMWLWFALNSKIAFQPEVTAVYRVLPESASHSRSLARRYQFRLRSNPVSEYFIERYADRFTPEFIHRARSSRHEQTLPMALLMRDWPTVDKIRRYYVAAEAAGHVTPPAVRRMLAHPRLWRELIRMRNTASDIKHLFIKC